MNSKIPNLTSSTNSTVLTNSKNVLSFLKKLGTKEVVVIYRIGIWNY